MLVYFRSKKPLNTVITWRSVLAVLALATTGLAGCTNSPEPNMELISEQVPLPALGNVEYHTYVLANELFANVAPAHCTGEAAFVAFREVFGPGFRSAGLGTVTPFP